MENETNPEDVTRILGELRWNPDAVHRLLPLIYDELRGIAKRVFDGQQGSRNQVQPTMLAHDVFMKLARKTDIEWESRVHFFAVAAKAIRDLLVDHARQEGAAKRGGDWQRVTLTGLDRGSPDKNKIDVIDLEDALRELRELSPRQEQIVEMRFFGGLTVPEVAHVLKVSERTVMYDWRMARAWLRSRLDSDE